MRSQMAIWRKRLDFVRTRTMGQHVPGFMRPEVAAGRRNLGVEIYSYNDHRSAPFSRACWLALAPPTLLGRRSRHCHGINYTHRPRGYPILNKCNRQLATVVGGRGSRRNFMPNPALRAPAEIGLHPRSNFLVRHIKLQDWLFNMHCFEVGLGHARRRVSIPPLQVDIGVLIEFLFASV